MKLLFLLFSALFFNAAFAIPLQERDKCSTTCLEGSKFNLRPGHSYQYAYESKIETRLIEGRSSTIRVHAQADVEVLDPCELVLHVHKAQLLKDRVPTSWTGDFESKLERNPLRFSYQDGKVVELCPVEEEEPWVLNIKRSILSAFQNSMEHMRIDQSVTETDLSGVCKTHYSIRHRGVDSVTIHKTKDLNLCMNRDGGRSVWQAMGERMPPELRSRPLVTSQQTCDQTILTEQGHIKQTICKETHIFKPFSSQKSGATVTTEHKMDFMKIWKHPHSRMPFIRGSSLVYSHEREETEGDNLDKALQITEELCRLSNRGLKSDVPAVFIKLIESMKKLSGSGLKQMERRVSSDRACMYARDYFMDALPMIGTSGSVEVMKDMILGGRLTRAQVNKFIISIGMISRPHHHMFPHCKTILKKFPTRSAMLSVSALLHTYCHHNSKCSRQPQFMQLIRFLESKLGKDCRSPNPRRYREVLNTLKALANIGHGFSIKTSTRVNSCIQKSENPMELRVAAIQVYRRVSCQISRRPLIKIYRNQFLDPELRINAYLEMMRCPKQTTIDVVAETMMTERSNQVGSFVMSHLRNLRTKTHRMLDVLEDEGLKKKFELSAHQFSRHFGKSIFIDRLNAGIKGEGNIIFSHKSPIPRSASFNVSTDIFGHSVNLMELGGRVEGLESLLDSIDKYAPKRPRRSVKTDERKVSAYLRMFGTEMGYLDEEDAKLAMKDILPVIGKLRKGKDIDFTKSVQFIDSSFLIPTIVGIPLRMAITGTASVHVQLKGKLDMSNYLNGEVDLDGELRPSAAVLLNTRMEVDAHYFKHGLRLESNVNTNSALKGRLALKGGRFTVNFRMAEKEQKIFQFKNTPYYDEKVISLPSKPTQKVCSREVFDLKLCYSTSSMKLNLIGWPMTIATDVSIDAINNKRDSSYKIEATWDKTNGRYTLLMDTPNSSINRKVSAKLQIKKGISEKSATLDVKTPSRSGQLLGRITRKGDNFNTELKASMNGQEKMAIRSTIDVSTKRDKTIIYKPTTRFFWEGQEKMSLTGVFEKAGNRKLKGSIELDGLTDVPIKLEGMLQRTLNARKRFRYDVMMGMESYPLTFKLKVLHDNSITIKTHRSVLTYRIKQGKQQQLSFSGKLKKTITGPIKKGDVTVTFTNSVNEKFNFKLEGKMSKTSDYKRIQTHLEIEVGKKPTANDRFVLDSKWRFTSNRPTKVNMGYDLFVKVPRKQPYSIGLKYSHDKKQRTLNTAATLWQGKTKLFMLKNFLRPTGNGHRNTLTINMPSTGTPITIDFRIKPTQGYNTYTLQATSPYYKPMKAELTLSRGDMRYNMDNKVTVTLGSKKYSIQMTHKLTESKMDCSWNVKYPGQNVEVKQTLVWKGKFELTNTVTWGEGKKTNLRIKCTSSQCRMMFNNPWMPIKGDVKYELDIYSKKLTINSNLHWGKGYSKTGDLIVDCSPRSCKIHTNNPLMSLKIDAMHTFGKQYSYQMRWGRNLRSLISLDATCKNRMSCTIDVKTPWTPARVQYSLDYYRNMVNYKVMWGRNLRHVISLEALCKSMQCKMELVNPWMPMRLDVSGKVKPVLQGSAQFEWNKGFKDNIGVEFFSQYPNIEKMKSTLEVKSTLLRKPVVVKFNHDFNGRGLKSSIDIDWMGTPIKFITRAGLKSESGTSGELMFEVHTPIRRFQKVIIDLNAKLQNGKWLLETKLTVNDEPIFELKHKVSHNVKSWREASHNGQFLVMTKRNTMGVSWSHSHSPMSVLSQVILNIPHEVRIAAEWNNKASMDGKLTIMGRYASFNLLPKSIEVKTDFYQGKLYGGKFTVVDISSRNFNGIASITLPRGDVSYELNVDVRKTPMTIQMSQSRRGKKVTLDGSLNFRSLKRVEGFVLVTGLREDVTLVFSMQSEKKPYNVHFMWRTESTTKSEITGHLNISPNSIDSAFKVTGSIYKQPVDIKFVSDLKQLPYKFQVIGSYGPAEVKINMNVKEYDLKSGNVLIDAEVSNTIPSKVFGTVIPKYTTTLEIREQRSPYEMKWSLEKNGVTMMGITMKTVIENEPFSCKHVITTGGTKMKEAKIEFDLSKNALTWIFHETGKSPVELKMSYNLSPMYRRTIFFDLDIGFSLRGYGVIPTVTGSLKYNLADQPAKVQLRTRYNQKTLNWDMKFENSVGKVGMSMDLDSSLFKDVSFRVSRSQREAEMTASYDGRNLVTFKVNVEPHFRRVNVDLMVLGERVQLESSYKVEALYLLKSEGNVNIGINNKWIKIFGRVNLVNNPMTVIFEVSPVKGIYRFDGSLLIKESKLVKSQWKLSIPNHKLESVVNWNFHHQPWSSEIEIKRNGQNIIRIDNEVTMQKPSLFSKKMVITWMSRQPMKFSFLYDVRGRTKQLVVKALDYTLKSTCDYQSQKMRKVVDSEFSIHQKAMPLVIFKYNHDLSAPSSEARGELTLRGRTLMVRGHQIIEGKQKKWVFDLSDNGQKKTLTVTSMRDHGQSSLTIDLRDHSNRFITYSQIIRGTPGYATKQKPFEVVFGLKNTAGTMFEFGYKASGRPSNFNVATALVIGDIHPRINYLHPGKYGLEVFFDGMKSGFRWISPIKGFRNIDGNFHGKLDVRGRSFFNGDLTYGGKKIVSFIEYKPHGNIIFRFDAPFVDPIRFSSKVSKQSLTINLDCCRKTHKLVIMFNKGQKMVNGGIEFTSSKFGKQELIGMLKYDLPNIMLRLETKTTNSIKYFRPVTVDMTLKLTTKESWGKLTFNRESYGAGWSMSGNRKERTAKAWLSSPKLNWNTDAVVKMQKMAMSLDMGMKLNNRPIVKLILSMGGSKSRYVVSVKMDNPKPFYLKYVSEHSSTIRRRSIKVTYDPSNNRFFELITTIEPMVKTPGKINKMVTVELKRPNHHMKFQTGVWMKSHTIKHNMYFTWDVTSNKIIGYYFDGLMVRQGNDRKFDASLRIMTYVREMNLHLTRVPLYNGCDSSIKLEWDTKGNKYGMVSLKNRKTPDGWRKLTGTMESSLMTDKREVKVQWRTVNGLDFRAEYEDMMFGLKARKAPGKLSVELEGSLGGKRSEIRGLVSGSKGNYHGELVYNIRGTEKSFAVDLRRSTSQVETTITTPWTQITVALKWEKNSNGYKLVGQFGRRIKGVAQLDIHGRMVDLRLFDGEDSYNVYAKLESDTSAVIEVYRILDGRHVTDFFGRLSIKPDGAIRKQISWRPESYRELRRFLSYVQRYADYYMRRVNRRLNSVAKLEKWLEQTEIAGKILRPINKEVKLVGQVLDKIGDDMMIMYKRDDFYIRTINEIFTKAVQRNTKRIGDAMAVAYEKSNFFDSITETIRNNIHPYAKAIHEKVKKHLGNLSDKIQKHSYYQHMKKGFGKVVDAGNFLFESIFKKNKREKRSVVIDPTPEFLKYANENVKSTIRSLIVHGKKVWVDISNRYRKPINVRVWKPQEGKLDIEYRTPFTPRSFKWHDIDPSRKWRAVKYEFYRLIEKYISVTDFLRYRPTYPFGGHATYYGHEDILTFDHRHIQFRGTCSYYLMKEKRDRFSVIGAFEGKQPELTTITIVTKNGNVEIRRDGLVKMGGRKTELPIMTPDLSIYRGSRGICVKSTYGWYMKIDMSRELVHIKVSHSLFNRVGGLFGNFNNEQYDELTMPNGEIAKTVYEFTRSWMVRPCRHANRATENAQPSSQCSSHFSNPLSVMRACFKHVDATFFAQRCTGPSICRAIRWYQYECKRHGVSINTPDFCNQCDGTGMRPTPKSADVLFVVDERSCNKESRNFLPGVAKTIDRYLNERGHNDNRFGLMGYGGHSKWPHYHTIHGKIFESSRYFKTDGLNKWSREGSSVFWAIYKVLRKQPFRPNSKKILVLSTCKDCSLNIFQRWRLSGLLNRHGIKLHILVDFEHKPSTNQILPPQNIVGYKLDEIYGTTKGKELLKPWQVRHSSGCATLATDVEGSVFNSGRLYGERKIVKASTDILAHHISVSVQKEQRRNCVCEQRKGMPVTVCYES